MMPPYNLGLRGSTRSIRKAKLDLDLAKGHSQRGGLSLGVRRSLAEALAVAMYQAGALEVDFHEILERLLNGAGPLNTALIESGMSADQIASKTLLRRRS